jgi:hypothetical protein
MVAAYHPSYVFWEKLTALHQFSTQDKDPDPHRLARHWYDVDCLLHQNAFTNALDATNAITDVVTMKSQRWAQKGVIFEKVLKAGWFLCQKGRGSTRLRPITKLLLRAGCFLAFRMISKPSFQGCERLRIR